MAKAAPQDTATLIESTVEQFRSRMEELKPQVDEYHELEGVVARITGTPKSSSGTGRRGRPRGSGSRAQEFLDYVQKNPGSSVADVAKGIGVNANYLYRVANQLQEDGKVEKQDDGSLVATAQES